MMRFAAPLLLLLWCNPEEPPVDPPPDGGSCSALACKLDVDTTCTAAGFACADGMVATSIVACEADQVDQWCGAIALDTLACPGDVDPTPVLACCCEAAQ